MYILDSMVDLGLTEGQAWPSAAHRAVAQSIALCNPLITSRDALTDAVQKIIAIPQDKIKTVTFADLPAYDLSLYAS